MELLFLCLVVITGKNMNAFFLTLITERLHDIVISFQSQTRHCHRGAGRNRMVLWNEEARGELFHDCGPHSQSHQSCSLLNGSREFRWHHGCHSVLCPLPRESTHLRPHCSMPFRVAVGFLFATEKETCFSPKSVSPVSCQTVIGNGASLQVLVNNSDFKAV